MEVLSSHNGGDPDDEFDQKISLLLLHGSVQDDIEDRFYHKVPEWNEEALQEANEHDVGVWRSLYDIIVPEMRAKLRLGDAKARTYPVNGKIYTEPEVTAICDIWKGIQDHKAVSDSVNAALARIADPDAAEWTHRNDPYIMAQCMATLSAWHDQQHRCLVMNGLTLHYLVYDKLKTMDV